MQLWWIPYGVRNKTDRCNLGYLGRRARPKEGEVPPPHRLGRRQDRQGQQLAHILLNELFLIDYSWLGPLHSFRNIKGANKKMSWLCQNINF